jgi:hypothetical protein
VGLIFPQKAVVLLLETDAACTSLNCHFPPRKVQFLFQYDAVNPQVIENKVCEGTDHLKAALTFKNRASYI